jgi:tetratricopeptide (TPR) repeat protein
VIGKTVSGRFELERLAGSGGMGAVYRARDLTDGSTVAVKILTGRELREAERFDLEAAILAELTHPAIVRYIAHGVEGGDHFIAMEWLEGEDLATRLDRKPLTVGESVTLVYRAAEALAYAHARGIVHRDIKPENLFLPEAVIARVKVLDFGIARLTHGGRKLTLTGSVIGTPGYMAPELVRGERDIRPSADIFSLGCVLFQCLTGRAVFEAEEATALLAKILLQDAPRAKEIAPGIPDALDEVVARMLAKDPAKRLADAKAVIAALEPVRAEALKLEGLTTAADRKRPQPALTATEQRIACVVIAGPSATAEARWYGTTPPLGLKTDGRRAPSEPSSAGRIQELEGELARVHGARLHPVPGGSVVIVLPDAGKPNDQAARAARCALAVRAELADVPLVVATGPGRFSAWSVVGEVIDNGVRLLRGTAPGAIRLDEMAVGLLDARFEIRRDGTASFLRAERDVFEVKRNLLGKASDFVGRGREMSMLSNVYTSSVAEQTAAAVLLTGAAGVGKSRVRQEFVEWVGKQNERAEVLFGIGDSLGAGSPFAMIGLCLRRAAGIQEGEPLDEKRRKLVERVGRTVDREVVPRVAAFLGEIANVPFPDDQNEALRMARQNPQLMGDAMRRSWEDWLAAECAARPVLLLLEDLHWGDLGTVSFVDAALRHLRDQSFMVLALARPDVEARFPDLWKARDLQVIRLAPLSKRASEKLVREALGEGVTDALVEQLIARADGNAFYLEELVRATAAGRHESLPDSVIGMVQARLDAEGAEARRVLRAASVFGERFSQAGVAALLGGEGELPHVGEWLELLSTRELVARAATAERRGDVEYTFTHALVREAAYAMLTADDRTLGHRLAGGFLEGVGASSDAMALAEHFRRGEEPARAVRWYERAAEQALKANDLAAAIERAELGLSCGATGEIAGALRLIEAEGHVWRGEFAEAERHALAAASARVVGSAGALRAVGSALVSAAKQGKLDVVEELVARVSGVEPEANARGAQISCLAWGATYLIFGARLAAADALMVLISEISRGLPDLDPQAQALIHQVRSFRASASGDLGGCLGGLEAALASFEQAGDLRNACIVRSNLGYLYSELGDFARAESVMRQALAAAERMGLREVSAAVQHNLGRVLGLRGQLAEAARLERQAIASFGQQGEPRLEGVARTYLSEILVANGEHATAEKEAALAAEELRVAPSLRVAALGALARARLARGNAAGGLAAARDAAAELAVLGEIEEGESSVRLTHAEALSQSGLADEARAALEAARERLLARAARIEESSWRERFLNDVPVNARILALAAQWSPPPPPRAPTAERPRKPTGTGPAPSRLS